MEGELQGLCHISTQIAAYLFDSSCHAMQLHVRLRIFTYYTTRSLDCRDAVLSLSPSSIAKSKSRSSTTLLMDASERLDMLGYKKAEISGGPT